MRDNTKGNGLFRHINADCCSSGALNDLARALREKDRRYWKHSGRVGASAGAIAAELGVGPDDMTDIALGGALHDIGKIEVPVRLLRSGRGLSNDEYLRVMEHVVIGERLLKPIIGDRPAVLGAVRSHHERVDGNGLPDGLKGNEIPLAARVVTVADAFDAMTHARPYRKQAMSVRSALCELAKWAGSHFDRACVQALMDWHNGRVEGESRPEMKRTGT